MPRIRADMSRRPALFQPDDPDRNETADYSSDCIGCHVPAKATDYVYVGAYPTLAPLAR